MERRNFLTATGLAALTFSCQTTTQQEQATTMQAPKTADYPKPSPFTESPGKGTRLWGPGGDKYEFLVTGQQSAGSTFSLQANVPPGGGPPPHIHTRENESYYITEGELLFTLNDERKTVKAGDFVFIPKGTVHTFTNKGSQMAKMVVTFVPAGMEGWFEEVLVPVKSDEEKAVVYTPKQLDFMIEAGPRHGVEWRLPPKNA